MYPFALTGSNIVNAVDVDMDASDVYKIALLVEKTVQKAMTEDYATSRDEQNLARVLAMRLYQVSGEMGHDRGTFKFASDLFNNPNSSYPAPLVQRRKKGREILQTLAENGMPHAQYALGLAAIAEGNQADALYFTTHAADNGFALAQFQLANWYKTGQIKSVDPSKAFLYMARAHEQKLIEATFMLALMYKDGFGCDADMSKYFELLMQASTGGLAVAQHNLGSLHLHGQNDKSPNTKLAIEYFRLASAQKFLPSQLNLVELYLYGHDDIKHDHYAARKFLKMAQDQVNGGRVSEAERQKILEYQSTIDSLPAPKSTCRIL